jgi:hypothetical protein
MASAGIKREHMYLVLGILAIVIVGYISKRVMMRTAVNTVANESFADYDACNRCSRRPCGCPAAKGTPSKRTVEPMTSTCPEPDPSKWVLKASVPPCPPMPDMSKYMLKTECPPQPDMSKYVLKSSVPACPPCISTCTKPCKIGECPPCPRPRCPVVKCPEPKACAPCPAATCAPCPEPDIKCKASYQPATPVRPMLASTSTFGF